MGFAEQFLNLGEDIMVSFDSRVNFLGKNLGEVKHARSDTHKLQNKFRKEQKTMGNKLRADLGGFMENLTEAVAGLRSKFQKQQRMVHNEFTAAHRNWGKIEKTLQAKRRSFKGGTNTTKQRAARDR